MEQGSKTLLIILGTALLIGALVVVFNPAYRQAFAAQVRGDPAASPIWKSNREYYPDVTLPAAEPAPQAPAEPLSE
ncbi:MAG: hypothetical protein GX548_11055 [Lentisphaerae bacterium]|nr:hypothetical protein [Lentisphaerota bacterium]